MLTGLGLSILHGNIEIWKKKKKSYARHTVSLERFTLYLKCLRRGVCSLVFFGSCGCYCDYKFKSGKKVLPLKAQPS